MFGWSGFGADSWVSGSNLRGAMPIFLVTIAGRKRAANSSIGGMLAADVHDADGRPPDALWVLAESCREEPDEEPETF